MLEQPTSVPHTLLHTSGTTQPTSSAGGRTSTQTQNQPTANTFARTVSTAELYMSFYIVSSNIAFVNHV